MKTHTHSNHAWLKFFVAMLLSVQAKADYTLPSDRGTTWNPGMNSVGGIPSRTTISTTLAPLGGGQDDSVQIQAALDACPVNEVVLLSAGTFVVNNNVIITKGITLRGAGSGVTILRKTNGAVLNSYTAADYQAIVIVGPSRFPGPDSTTSQNLAADAAKGAMSVSVVSGAGFAAGQIVLLDELSGASWQTDRLGRGQIWASPDYRVVWQFHNPAQGFDDPLVATTPTSGDAASWFCRQDRPTTETKEVASVAGNVITFTTPLHINYRASHTAQLTRYTANGNGGVQVKNAGVESLTVSGGSDGAIRFECATYSWAKDVEITLWLGEGCAINNSFRVEFRDSYVHDAAWAQPGGAGYAISLADGSAEALVENNIIVMANKVMVARCAGAGSVFGYNYADDGFINTIGAWIECGLNASHMVGSHHVLFEGNYGFNWDSDHTHGNSIYHTIFRNQLRGLRRPFVDPLDGVTYDDATQSGHGPMRCAGDTAYSTWMSFVGNVLGAQGQMAGFTYDVTGPDGQAHPAIWMLGWDDTAPQPYDQTTHDLAIRDGNWDWLQSVQSWHNTSAVALQNSMYLSAKPAFFGSNTWPWVDPTTGTTYTLPAKARYEAIVGGGSAPPAPTSLAATPGNAQIALTWNSSSGATSYNVYRGTTAGGESTTAIATGVATTSYTNTGLTNGTAYFYEVQAVNANGTSGYSNEASATPSAGSPPSAPTSLAAATGNAQISLSWNSSSGATSYNVYRGTSAGGESTTAIVTGVTATSYTNTGLTNGTTYFYEVKAVNASGTSGYSNEASATPIAPPSAPTGLAAIAGNTQVALNWNSSSGATSYNVYRGTSAGGESTTAVATGVAATSYTNTGLTNGTTYFYEVKAVNASGTSGYSNEASATPSAGGALVAYNLNSSTAPLAPSTVGSGVSSASNIGFGGNPSEWSTSAGVLQDNPGNSSTAAAAVTAGNYATFTVTFTSATSLSSLAFDGCYSQFSSPAGYVVRSSVDNYAANLSTANFTTQSPTFVTQTVTLGTSFQNLTTVTFRIYGFVSNTGSVQFDNITINGSGGGSPPLAPTGLAASPGNAQVVLGWNASTGATSYNVYRGTSAGGESTTAIATGVTATAYTNTGLTNGTAYFYEVKAVNASGASGYSNEASATPIAPPPAPTGLAGTAGNAQVALSWNASTGATSYNVYRGTSAGGESTTAIATGVTATAYTNTGLTNGTAYFYEVKAVNASGASGYSNEASTTPIAPPPAPTGLAGTAGNAQVALSWNASTGATSYNVYRGTSAGGESTTAIATGVAATAYTNTGLTNGTVYFYKVKAVNASGTSGYSNEASATPAGPPPAPTGLAATAGNAQVALSWNASSGATSYNVYRGTSAGGESTTAIVTGVTATSYTNTGLTNGTTYFYEIKAVNASGTSGYSNEVSATPSAGSPRVVYNLNSTTAPLAASTVGAGVSSASNIGFGGNPSEWSTPTGVLQDNPGNSNSAAAAVTAGNYATFTITFTSATSLSSLAFDGCYSQFSNPAGYVVRSSVDNYATNLSTAGFTTQSPTFVTQTITLGAAFQSLTTVTFRIYGYVSNTGSVQFDNITVR